MSFNQGVPGSSPGCLIYPLFSGFFYCMNKDPKKSRGLVIERVEEAETLFCLHKAIVIGIMQVNLRSSNIRVTKEHGELIDIPVGIKQVICCERMPFLIL